MTCSHGSSLRQCELCQRDEDIERLEKDLADVQHNLDTTTGALHRLEEAVSEATEHLEALIVCDRAEGPWLAGAVASSCRRIIQFFPPSTAGDKP